MASEGGRAGLRYWGWPVVQGPSRSITVRNLGLFISSCVLVVLSALFVEAADPLPDIVVHARTCAGSSIGGIVCSSLSPNLLWDPEVSECPAVPPGKALDLAMAQIRRTNLLSGDIRADAIMLLRCNSGWAYSLQFSSLSDCEGAKSEAALLTTGAIVLMNGQVVLPDRKVSSAEAESGRSRER